MRCLVKVSYAKLRNQIDYPLDLGLHPSILFDALTRQRPSFEIVLKPVSFAMQVLHGTVPLHTCWQYSKVLQQTTTHQFSTVRSSGLYYKYVQNLTVA
jgi:hypothetical protein